MNIRQLEVKVPSGEVDKIINEVLSKGENLLRKSQKVARPASQYVNRCKDGSFMGKNRKTPGGQK